jgi:hypothetical protein
MTTPSYDTDFYARTQAQAQALQAKDLAGIDIDHLAEEVADLGSNQRYAIGGQLERLLVHMLKWPYDPAQSPRRGWRVTIRHARREIAKSHGDSPSLRDHLAWYLATAYRHAPEDAADETDLPLATFPEACPWSLAQVLDDAFWPEA